MFAPFTLSLLIFTPSREGGEPTRLMCQDGIERTEIVLPLEKEQSFPVHMQKK